MKTHRGIVVGLSYTLTVVTIAMTLVWIGFLVVASTILLPFDIAYRFTSERLKG